MSDLRFFLVIALVILLLVALLTVELANEATDHDTVQVKTVQHWGTESAPYVIASDMFTTTTTPRARTAPTKRLHVASVGPAIPRPARYPTGCTTPGTLDPAPCIPASRPCAIPAYICARESQGRINVWNHAGSGASGKYQAMPSTWGGYGGYQYAAWAPEEVQDEWAAALWNSPGGHRHWGAA